MGGRDDFKLWERELDERRERSGVRGMLAVAIVITLACAALIVMGDLVLGIVGMALSGLILLLWRLGL